MAEEIKDDYTEEELLNMEMLPPGTYRIFGQKEAVRVRITKKEMPQFIERLKNMPKQQ